MQIYYDHVDIYQFQKMFTFDKFHSSYLKNQNIIQLKTKLFLNKFSSLIKYTLNFVLHKTF